MKKNILELVGLTIEDMTREVYQFSKVEEKIKYLGSVYGKLDSIADELEEYYGNWGDYLNDNSDVDNSQEGQSEFLLRLEPEFESIISNHILKYFIKNSLRSTLMESIYEFDDLLDDLSQLQIGIEYLYTKIHLLNSLNTHDTELKDTLIEKKQLKDGALIQHTENFWKLEGRDIDDPNDDKFLMPEEKERMKEYCDQFEGLEYKNMRAKLRKWGMVDYDNHMKNRNVY